MQRCHAVTSSGAEFCGRCSRPFLLGGADGITPCELLNVTIQASTKEIKRTHNRLAKNLNPDFERSPETVRTGPR